MNELIERIHRDGKNFGNGILKVDGFINHQVDPALMEARGRQLDARMPVSGKELYTQILTIGENGNR